MPHRGDPRRSRDPADVPPDPGGAGRRGQGGGRRAARANGGRDHGGRRQPGRNLHLVSPLRPDPRPAAGARGAARPRRPPRREARGPPADPVLGLPRAPAVPRRRSGLTRARAMPERLLLQPLRPYARRYALGFGCLALATLCALAIPWTLKRAIEALQAGSPVGELQRYVLLILVLAAAHGLVRLGSRFAILGGSQAVEFDLRQSLYGHLQRLPLGFYQAHRTGDLMSRASNDLSP